jgi:outer membrane protein OmpA-like peptidoglycan-associated protein
MVVAALAVTPAVAQELPPEDAAVDIEMFHPYSDDLGTPMTSSGTNRQQWQPTFGFWLHYARSPLLRSKSDGTVLQEVVGRRVASEVTADVPLMSWLSVRAQMPWTWFQHGSVWSTGNTAGREIAPLGIGDFGLGMKLTMLDLLGASLALSLDGYLPTGDKTAYLGEKNASLRSLAHLSYAAGPFFFGGWTGLRLRESTVIGDLVIGNELLYGVGGAYALPLDLGWSDFSIYADIYGRGGVENMLARTEPSTNGVIQAVRASPLEGDVGVRWRLYDQFSIFTALGAGLLGGYGAPAYRVMFGLQYTIPSPRPDSDRDGLFDDEDGCPLDPEDRDLWEDADGCPDTDNDQDGLLDLADTCPNRPEDKDDYQDADGCPDPDNDADQILDEDDGCRDEPEDKDGFEDADGCPDLDNDQDGFPDPADSCPDVPEDKDGFEDEDGCPESDNDQDGVLDADDRCPAVPEDKDGFEDEDGCPDPDNDKDGVADVDDACPIEPEVINGFEDEDGCPDEGKQVVVLKAEKIEISDTIEFDVGKATLRPAGKALLDQVAQVLKGHQTIRKLSIEGHTSSEGNDAFNMKLSKDRAAAVMKYLVEEKSIDAERLQSEGFGETRPIDDNKTKAGRARNRRVEFLIVEQDDNWTAPAPEAAPDAEAEAEAEAEGS